MEVSFRTSWPHKSQDPGAILRLSDIVLSTASFRSLGLARWRGWWQIAEDAWETTAGRDVKRCTARRKHVCWCRMYRLPSLMSICFPWRHKSSLLNACSCWKTSFFVSGARFLGCLGITTNFPSFILSKSPAAQSVKPECRSWMRRQNDRQGSVQKQSWKRMRVTGSLTSFNFYVF